MTQERRIHWNTETADRVEGTVRWYFLVINEPREINSIRENIFRQLQPIHAYREIDANLIPNSQGLHYSLMSVETVQGKFPSNATKTVYGGNWKKDRRLYTRADESTLLNIIEQDGLV